MPVSCRDCRCPSYLFCRGSWVVLQHVSVCPRMQAGRQAATELDMFAEVLQASDGTAAAGAGA